MIRDFERKLRTSLYSQSWAPKDSGGWYQWARGDSTENVCFKEKQARLMGQSLVCGL